MQNDIEILKIEKYFRDKYGEEVIKNPLEGITKEEIKKIREQLLDFERELRSLQTQKKEINEILVSKKLINNRNNKKCSKCGTLSLKKIDSVSIRKHKLCYTCYEIKKEKEANA